MCVVDLAISWNDDCWQSGEEQRGEIFQCEEVDPKGRFIVGCAMVAR